jgi:hypothetical protein
MIRRLVEAHYDAFFAERTPTIVGFWLRELRTATLLQQVAKIDQEQLSLATEYRSWLSKVNFDDIADIERSLQQEEMRERQLDEAYWRPLKQELAELRARRRGE